MEFKFTLKIKDKLNPPDWGQGKGVVAKITIDFKGVTGKDYLNSSPILQKQLYDKANELLDEYFEVTFDRVKTEKPKFKLSPFNINLKTALKTKTNTKQKNKKQ